MRGLQMSVELMSDHLTKTLIRCVNELLAELSDTDWEAYIHLVDLLRKTDVASRALQVGDTAPDFLLPDAHGRLHSSEHPRGEGPLVSSFYRDGWCPFCNAELCGLRRQRYMAGSGSVRRRFLGFGAAWTAAVGHA
jgi:hypothetical protein